MNPMTTKLSALLFLTLPLAAQADDRVPHAFWRPLQLEVRVDNAALTLVCSSDQKNAKSIGIVVASASGKTMQFPGLPPLLVPEAVLVCGSLASDLIFKVPFPGLPFDLHIQAAGIVSGELALSPRRVVPMGQSDADQQAAKGDK